MQNTKKAKNWLNKLNLKNTKIGKSIKIFKKDLNKWIKEYEFNSYKKKRKRAEFT